LSYGFKEPWTSKINFRMLAFAGVLLLLIGYPIYVYVDAAVSGGIHDVGNGYKEVDLKAMSVFPFARRCAGRRLCRSLRSCRRAWSVWRRAGRRITGPAS